jgi:2-dehydro-3-deoxyphosphooctonate aldolase (KDO 8-P synthase)
MITIGNITIGNGNSLVLIAGPCVVEGREITFRTASQIQKIAKKYNVPVIFKASYKKANRTSGNSFASLGMDESLKILLEVKKELGMPVLTDVHGELEAASVAEVVDVLQVPAFLCRQTELLHAVGRTGKPVNVKKGQFLAPEDMKYAADKIKAVGNNNIMLTERGATFGYHNLVVDMRALVIMRNLGYPVILDATHSIQLPSGAKNHSSGQPEYIFPIARAGVAVGIDGLFVETHPDPMRALSDAASQLKLEHLDELVRQVMMIDHLVKEKLAL